MPSKVSSFGREGVAYLNAVSKSILEGKIDEGKSYHGRIHWLSNRLLLNPHPLEEGLEVVLRLILLVAVSGKSTQPYLGTFLFLYDNMHLGCSAPCG